MSKRLEAEGPWLMGGVFGARHLCLHAVLLGQTHEISVHVKFPTIAKLVEAVRARPKLKAALEAHGVMEPRS